MSFTKTKRYKNVVEEDNQKLSLRGNLYKKNKQRNSRKKIYKSIFILGTSATFIMIVIYVMFLTNRTSAESINQQTVLNRLSQILILPSQNPTSVMRVSKAGELANEDPFYKNVSNGDYIIVFQGMMLVYDFNKGLIKNIKTN